MVLTSPSFRYSECDDPCDENRGRAPQVSHVGGVLDVGESRAPQSPALRAGFTLEGSDDFRRDPPAIKTAGLRDDWN